MIAMVVGLPRNFLSEFKVFYFHVKINKPLGVDSRGLSFEGENSLLGGSLFLLFLNLSNLRCLGGQALLGGQITVYSPVTLIILSGLDLAGPNEPPGGLGGDTDLLCNFLDFHFNSPYILLGIQYSI